MVVRQMIGNTPYSMGFPSTLDAASFCCALGPLNPSGRLGESTAPGAKGAIGSPLVLGGDDHLVLVRLPKQVNWRSVGGFAEALTGTALRRVESVRIPRATQPAMKLNQPAAPRPNPLT